MPFIPHHLYIVCVHPSCVLTCPPLASPFAWAKATAPHWPPTLTSPLLSFVAVKYIFSCLWPPQGIPHGPHGLHLGPAHLTQYMLARHHRCPPAPLVSQPRWWAGGRAWWAVSAMAALFYLSLSAGPSRLSSKMQSLHNTPLHSVPVLQVLQDDYCFCRHLLIICLSPPP